MTLQMNAIGITVADMDRARAFYAHLGLDFQGEDDHFECTLPGGIRIMLDHVDLVKTLVPNWEQPSGSSRVSFAYECGSPAEVDSHYDELIKAGAGSLREPWDAFWGQRYAVITDPDGNEIGFYAPL